MRKNFFKNISVSYNNLFLFCCLISNLYSGYLQDRRNQEILLLIREQKKDIQHYLDSKVEKLKYSLELLSERSNVGIEKIKNKISLVQDKMTDQNFLLTTNIAQQQPQKADSSFKVTLFDQVSSSWLLQLILCGVIIGSCFYVSNSLSGLKLKDVLKELTSSISSFFEKKHPDVTINSPIRTAPFTVPAEDKELLNKATDSIFKDYTAPTAFSGGVNPVNSASSNVSEAFTQGML